MKKSLFLILVLAAAILPAAEHPVAADGKAKMVIVYPPSAYPKAEYWDHIYQSSNTPDFGAKYLAGYLKEITGAEFRRIPEKQWDGQTPAFLVGPTEFSRKHGIDFSRFKPEEWLYKSAGKNIVLGGGANFGQIIAINKLLEKELGCAFLAFDERYFPVRKTVTLPQLNRRGEPSFSRRSIYTIVPKEKSLARKLMLFQRFNRGSIHGREVEFCKQTPRSHTLYHYVNPDIYFKKHPEYFSMDQKGKRFCGSKKTGLGGQICFFNPETAKIAEAQLRKFIGFDRKNTPKEKWPVVYGIWQIDGTNFLCCCPECKKITEREGGDSGLQLHFINKIAKNIAKDYPEIIIQTYAYVSTERAPKYIKPEKNVRIEWCDLYTHSDCFRPITHPVNRKQLAILQSWLQRGIPVSCIWDYWNIGGKKWNFPPRIETMAPAIKGDLAYYHAVGVRQFFTEVEHLYYDVDFNFYDLQLYLGLQLLDDVTQDEQELISRFMRLYYGPAEKYMYQAYRTIAEAIASVPKTMGAMDRLRSYQNAAFVKTVYDQMKQAQQSVLEKSAFRFRVERELLPVLRTMVYFSNLRAGKSREEVLNEYKNLRFRQLDYLYTPEEVKKVQPLVEKEIERVSFDFPTPEPFRNLKADELHKYSALDFRGGMVTDPESKLKNVIRVGFPLSLKKTREKHAAPDLDTQHGKTIFGVTNITEKQTKRIDVGEEIPQDEKYHWYCIRNCKIGPSSVFWAWAWWTLCELGKVYMDGKDNLYDVWFSLKIVGPAYVRDSNKENDFFLECIILTKPGAVKTLGR